ncbi:MAG: tyrosine-type recombinase/integrase [Treponema sp.]|nr:tyrosine-type recombinase/integrase [Treponema sp.]
MKVVYLYCESNVIRIPFYKYENGIKRDEELFSLFCKNNGIWDAKNQQFLFPRNSGDNFIRGIVSKNVSIYVLVRENTSLPPEIHGFLERPWKKETADHEISQYEISQKSCLPLKRSFMPTALPLPSTLSSVPASVPPSIPFSIKSLLEQEFYPRPPEKFDAYWQEKLEDSMRAVKYSSRTVQAYLYYNRLICRTLQKPPEKIRPPDITQFLAGMEKNRAFSASSINLAISAVKYFYKSVYLDNIVKDQRRPHSDKKIPMILDTTEILKILGAEKNLKHLLLLVLAYSSGLRVSEVVALKKEHIDQNRKVIYVDQGKGRKDRLTVLSERANLLLNRYYGINKINVWLFPGKPQNNHLSIRSAQYIFDRAVEKANIVKKVSIHSLRHSFATHLLENGTDIRYIQALLGHTSLRTTERYTHVARGNILNIKSPFDGIC